MAYVPVNIFVLAKGGISNPIPGVLVRLFDRQGRVIHTQGTTDAQGLSTFLLPTEQAPYQARCYNNGVAFAAPALITPSTAPPNNFVLYGETLTRPLSQDPRVCVAYGYFKDGTNGPFEGCTVHFMPKFQPLVLDGNAVLKERTLSKTDKNGYLEIGLIRCAKYEVLVEGMEDEVRVIYVPDTANVNLPDLLFPVVDSVTISQAIGQIHVGEEVTLYPHIWASSGLELHGTSPQDVRWSSSDPDVLACTITQEALIIRGMKPGVAQLQAIRMDNSVVRIPNTPIKGLPIAVTVIP